MRGSMLVRARGDPIAVVGAAACAGGLSVVAPVATSFAVGVGIVVLAAGRKITVLAAVLAFFVASARASAAIDAFEQQRAHAVSARRWPARVSVVGRIARSPVLVRDALRVEVAGASGRTALYVPSDQAPVGLARGDEVEAIAQLAPLDRFWNEDLGDPRPNQARRGVVLSGGAPAFVVVRRGLGIAATIDRARDHVRRRILATFTPESRAMARALVLGEDDVDDADRRAFARSGLAHLLAVSGMHLVVVVAAAVGAIRGLLLRVPAVSARWDSSRIASVLGLPLVWLYADFAGESGSAVRAAWMASAALVAHVLERKPDGWRSAGLALLAAAVSDPLAAFDVSFVLSALATAAILGVAGPIASFVAPRAPRAPSFLVKAMAATTAATFGTAPVIACMSEDLPLGSLLANVVAVPVGDAAALPLSLAHAVLEPWPAAERGCAVAASGALVTVREVARAFAWTTVRVPAPGAAQLSVAAAAVFVFLHARRFVRPRTVPVAIAALAALELLARARGAPREELRATFLDVGQGDAALVDLPDGTAMLIDGGGLVGSPVDVGARVLSPVLRARRRGRIDVVVLSHPHPDHYLGLVSALEGVEVGAIWDTGQGESEGAGPAYGRLLARMRARGVPILRPRELCGKRIVGGATVEVIAPCPEIDGDRGPNDNSFVLRLRHGSRAILFAGDAEHVEEASIVARSPADLRADVLKVGHHGSRTSSTRAFVAAVAPRIAIVSCGIRNRFGHPHDATLETLASAGAGIFRTDRDGSVTVSTDGTSLEVRAAARPYRSGSAPRDYDRSTTPM